MVRLLGLIAAMLAVLAGGTGTALAQDATPSPTTGMAANAMFADTMGLPELAITATDSEYQGVPAETAAGRYVVTLTYSGSDPFGASVQFMQLPEGMTVDTLMTALAPPAAEATPVVGDIATPMAGMEMTEGTPAAEEGGEGGAPEWYYQTYHAGGFGAVPGQTAQVILDLIPGNYFIWSGNPEGAQAPVALTVTGDMAASPMAGMDMGTPMAGMAGMAEPTANVTVTEVKTADGFAFELDGTFAAGDNVIEIYNDSDQPHFFGLYGYPEPITLEQAEAFLMFDPSMGTPPPGMLDETLLFQGAFANVQSPGTTQWLAANLQPGYYIAVCFVGDPTKGGLPHAFEGMVEVIQVS